MLKKDTWSVFKTIVRTQPNVDISITEFGLTRKQYYSSMSQLMQLGLIKKTKGKFVATSFGIVIYNIQLNLEKTVQDALFEYWKIKAIDSLIMPSMEETQQLIRSLITNQRTRSLVEDSVLEYQSSSSNVKHKQYVLLGPQCS